MRKSVNFFLNIWSFPAESVLGAPTVLPNEFLQGDEVAVDSIIKNFKRSFTLQIGSREEVVAVSRLKACTTEDAALGGSPMETQSVRLRVYLRTRGYKTPVSIPVHTPYINAYVIQIN
jgi:hypothetical protein